MELKSVSDKAVIRSIRVPPESESVSGVDDSRWAVDVDRIVDCPFTRSIDEAHVIFPMLERTTGVRLPFRRLRLPIDGAIAHFVTTHFHRRSDQTERGRAHDEVEFEWCARSRWLPDLHGVLRFRIAGVGTRIILHADYVPPFGRLGSLFDRFVGRRIARATAADLVERLAIALETSWAEELKRYPADRSTVRP